MKKANLNKIKQVLQTPVIKFMITTIVLIALAIASNLYLQWSQNNHSAELALNFAFSWHVEKFFLGCFVLLVLLLLVISICGSPLFGAIFYSFFILVLGYADYLKMDYREEPVYPDDLKMITEFGMMKDIVGWLPFLLILAVSIIILLGVGWQIYQSFKLPLKQQALRLAGLAGCLAVLFYISQFNNEENLLRKAYNRTALWIPYSQKMNYYNVGFVGGFLYNLHVKAMEKPEGYSKENVQGIVEKYQVLAEQANEEAVDDQPNIIYIMSESFSDPSRLTGITVAGEPLADYYKIADQTYSGWMLSQNYGGGTANIEFEALTGFAMEPMTAQMTTPYTMLVNDLPAIPSLVTMLKDQGYYSTAIHPYNTSMYKRKDVYQKMDFDQFLDESSMKHTKTIENNPYISDQAAYQEIMDLLTDQTTPQFVHLVTMQTHMPYGGKYQNIGYSAQGNDNDASLDNYLQDIAYSSEALQDFLAVLNQLDRRTLVVFWGDHLPGIYSEKIQAKNAGSRLHETQFLMYDSAGKLTEADIHDEMISPFYFAPKLLSQADQPITGFYQLLLNLQEGLPAFEKGFYYHGKQWFEEMQMNSIQKERYEEYQLIQYDIVAGNQYSLQMDFFKE